MYFFRVNVRTTTNNITEHVASFFVSNHFLEHVARAPIYFLQGCGLSGLDGYLVVFVRGGVYAFHA